METQPTTWTVTFPNSKTIPDMRVCPNLGCKMHIFKPQNVLDHLCPLCYAQCDWKVEDLHYTITRVYL